jgi:protein-tyrosine phosphatase
MQATFSATPLGHAFVLRTPLAKATANKCATCASDIFQHGRDEVKDEQLLAVINAQDDGRPTPILANELAVGSYKAALAACRDQSAAIINAAGRKLHDFMPRTRAPFDVLRAETPPRLFDLEWEDSETFTIELESIIEALAFARAQLAAGRHIVVNCAQGKSRSGTIAVAFLVARLKLSVKDALSRAQQCRPLIQPNGGFMRQLCAFEGALLQQEAPISPAEHRLRRLYSESGGDAAGGLSKEGLRKILIACGHPANAAARMCPEGVSLSLDAFVQAWVEEGLE